jgi:hypothetical protein
LLWAGAEFLLFAQQITKKLRQRNQRKIFAKNCGSNFGIEPPEFFYCVIVTFRAAEWLVAEVAVTMMLEIPGGVPVVGLCWEPFPPPQLTTQRSNAMLAKTTE